MSKKFHISDVLSITHDKLVSTRGMTGVYDILGYMTDDEGITTIGLMFVQPQCEASLKEQHPWLSEVPEFFRDDSEGAPPVEEQLDKYLLEVVAKYGEFVEVTPLM